MKYFKDNFTIKEIIKNLPKDENKMHFPNLFQAEDAIQYSTKYHKQNCNMKLLNQQQEILKNLILDDKDKDYFEVVNMECGTGKTYTMIQSIPYYFRDIALKRIDKQGILIVLRQISECEKYTEELNKLFNRKIALSATSDEYNNIDYTVEEKKKIKQEQLIKVPYYPIVFITHSKYKILCSKDEERRIFTKNRRLLIIDESIDICEIVKLDNDLLEKFTSLILNEKDGRQLIPVLQPIVDRISKAISEENVIHNFKTTLKNLEILDKIENNENLEKYAKSEQEQIKQFIFIVRCIYNNTSLINVRYYKDKKTEETHKKVEISTTNYKLNMWKLKNNIILDASAPLNMKYDLDTRMYHNLNLEPVLDHSRWKIKYVWANSTKTAKGIDSKELQKNYVYKDIEVKEIEARNKYRKNFYKCCSEILEELGENDTLAVGTKAEHIIEFQDEEKKINPFRCNIPLDNIVHYGDITGKREYGELKNVLVFHTFNYTTTDYILQYLYYANIRNLKDGTTFDAIKPKSYILDNIPIFSDSKLQEYKEKTMANHLYQAIKRVNREMLYDTTVVIVSIYLGAILYVRDMLNNCECKEYKEYYLKFDTNTKQEKNTKEKSDYQFSKFIERVSTGSRALKIIELFRDILNDNIPKDLNITKITEHILELQLADLREYLQMTTKQCSNALADNTFLEFQKENLIIYTKCRFHFNLY